MDTHRPRPLSGPRVAFLRSPRLARARPRRGGPTIRDPPTCQTAPSTASHPGSLWGRPPRPVQVTWGLGVGCCSSCLGNGQIVVHESQFFSNGAAATPSELGGNRRSRSCRSRRRGSKTQIRGQGFGSSPRSDPSWGASCGRHPGSAPVRQIALGVGPPRGRLLRRAEAARSQMSRPSTWRAV